MHPHRGFEIATYILDGSDGFRHKDSLGGECLYRGGSLQWMRAGAGAMHEEMWETRDDRPTSIELFQIWINLPQRLKMTQPYIRMLGGDWGAPFPVALATDELGRQARVRVLAGSAHGVSGPYEFATPLVLAHAHLDPGATWHAPSEPGHTAMVYVREGDAWVPGGGGSWSPLPTLQSATLRGEGPAVVAAGDRGADLMYFAARPHHEPVARGGPIVMNYNWEVAEAFKELLDGSFLKGGGQLA